MTDNFRALIEAALFVSGRTLSIEELAKICKSGSIGVIRKILEDLQKEYHERNSGLEIYESNGEYGMRVKKEFEGDIMHLVPETDMSPAMLKTLALIAYEQPIKQSKVVKERGNRAYRYIRKLIEQELIEGKKSGRTRILTTTSKFRDYFQIQDLRELVKEEAEKVEEIEWE
ncbi:MAG: SMC-Scp complex subunit ScpB [Candidatus Altiarchaeales archaeon]|nr:MAG: SMC-Scp complex subunit ScpB [Candidatus Altiarchaeales archaeon]